MMKPRRILAVVLIIVGIVLMVAAPESAGAPSTGGAIGLIVLGMLIELVGIMLERRP